MPSISKFGQYVRLEVKDRSNAVVLKTDSLRVDFDIRDVVGWVRAKIEIYNLSPSTITKLMGGENYVTITTALHDGPEVVIAKDLYVSNSIDVFDVPNNVTTLYCYSKLKKSVLEKRVNKQVERPSLNNLMDAILDKVFFKGNVKYINFPDNYVEDVPLNLVSKQEGSVQSCIEDLGKYYRFHHYIDGEDITLVYAVSPKNAGSTGLTNAEPTVILNTDNMRSNPIIGPATINITSNLDTRIKPGAILSVKQLLTASTSATQEQLELTEQYLSIIAGFNNYQTYSVNHIGSNWTGNWTTKATGLAPTKGYNAPVGKNTWFR